MKIIVVAGARPNFIKIMPILAALKSKKLRYRLVHTGQHYDYRMSEVFFEDLNIPKPDIFLNVGSDSHARQTARIMIGFEKVLIKERPDLVLVVGDVNSTLACALTARKLHMTVAHVEAGLRSFDKRMPEEINRILTDQISDILFTPSLDGNKNLKREGVSCNKIYFVGNVMIDTLMKFKDEACARKTYLTLGLEKNNYALLTLHRPENVDCFTTLKPIIDAIMKLSFSIKVVFPVHPRTRKNLMQSKLFDRMEHSGIAMIEPLGYLDFLNLTMHARLVLTDSGGLQEETSVLGIPCLTLRDNTERPITITSGTNRVVGRNPQAIAREAKKILARKHSIKKTIKRWDGRAALRIASILKTLAR